MDIEKKLWSQGFLNIGGIDEAGRGSWAGPVVAAVVVLPLKHKQNMQITDSKLVSAKNREKLYSEIIDFAVDYGVGIVSHEIIDKVGILTATKLAAKQAVESLKIKPDYLLTDALDLREYLDVKQEAFIKGDQKIYSISCASIIAKVSRDVIMKELDHEYGIYQFSKHKGYGTALHQELLNTFGPSNIHRKSYAPIKKYYE